MNSRKTARLLLFPAILGLPATILANDESTGEEKYIRETSLALVESLSHVASTNIDIRGNNIFVSRKGRFIVVSLLSPEKVLGGRVHVVFDTSVDKVVYVSGED